MKDGKKIITFPYIGKYTFLFQEFFERIGMEVVLPPKITDRTIKIGTKYSSEMMCFPYKVTLGNFIEVLEKNPEIDYLLMYDSRGRCRFRHYYKLQDQILKNLGFKAKMIPLNFNNLLRFQKEINPSFSRLKLIREYLRVYNRIKKESKNNRILKDKPNIIIIGEIYTCIESSVNYDIEKKLEDFGINAINTVNLHSFIKESIKKIILKDRFGGKYHRKAMKYLNGPLGGHGAENIENLLRYIDKKIEGVIWLRPLSCMPESTVDLVVKEICYKNDVPIIVFDIDESNFALNIETRLETFVEQIKIKNEQ